MAADPASRIARVVVDVEPFHLDRPFDYLVPEGSTLREGQRVEVVFAGRRTRGLVVGLSDESAVDDARLRPVHRVLGEHVWVRSDELEVLRWAAGRFGAPLADVVRHALPARTVDVERRAATAGWFPPGSASRSPSGPWPAGEPEGWGPYGSAGIALLEAVNNGRGSFSWRPKAGEDVAARIAELVERTLAGNRDVVVAVGDRGSRVAQALMDRFGDLTADLRGDRSPRRLYGAWLRARCGVARVVVGERGAAFAPVERLGLAIVVDEANPAFKERRSPRHHAREVLLERARRTGGVGLLVGLVPSAAAWRLIDEGRVRAVTASADADEEHRPRVQVVDWRRQPRARLSREAVQVLRAATRVGQYGVVLAVRRGEGRAFVCGGCGGWIDCPRCGTSPAHFERRLACPGCGWRSPADPACRSCGDRRLVPLAAGAQRLAHELRRALDAPIAVLEGYDAPAPDPPAVLVMTRGAALDAPPGPVDAVVLPDIDALLRRPSLDAAEDALRLAMTLAGWTRSAGGRTGTVVVQTGDPGHHAVEALRRWDPDGFWAAEVALRAPLRFPPTAHAIRLIGDPAVGDELRGSLAPGDELIGPVPIEGLHGFLVKSGDRIATLAALAPLRSRCGLNGIELRVDVDPVDGV